MPYQLIANLSASLSLPLGLIGFLQSTFLPGFVLARALGVTGLARQAIVVFAMSLCANQLLVLLLTPLGLFVRPVMFVVVLLELVLLYFVERHKPPPLATVEGTNSPPPLVPSTDTLRGLALLAFAFFAVAALQRMGTVFTAWDTVFHWNGWAVSWFSGDFPRNVAYYPQLLPTNYAITYAFLGGAELQFFAKAIANLFPPFMILVFVDMARRTRDGVYDLAAMIAALLYWYGFEAEDRLLFSGYADAPIAFFAIATYYLLLSARMSTDRTRANLLLFAGICAGGAAATKQMGLLVVVAFAPMALCIVYEARSLRDLKQHIRYVVPALAAALIVCAPFYVWQQVRIGMGMGASNLSHLAIGIHGGAGLAERLAYSWELVAGRLGPVPAVLLVGLSLLGLGHRTLRWPGLFVAFPYFAIWAVVFGYDFRNTSLSLVFFTPLAAGGFFLLPRLRLSAVRRRGYGITAIGVAVVLIVVFAWLSPREALLAVQKQEQRKIGLPWLNERLYAIKAAAPFKGKILTHYNLLNHLDGFRNRAAWFDIGQFEEFETLRVRPDIQYILIPTVAHPAYDPRVVNQVRELVRLGELRTLFDEGWMFAERVNDEHEEILKVTRILINSGRCEEARANIERGLQLVPEDSELFYYRGFCAEAARDFVTAKEAYDQALALGYYEFWVRYHRGIVNMQLGRHEQAREDLNLCIAAGGPPELIEAARSFAVRTGASIH